MESTKCLHGLVSGNSRAAKTTLLSAAADGTCDFQGPPVEGDIGLLNLFTHEMHLAKRSLGYVYHSGGYPKALVPFTTSAILVLSKVSMADVFKG